MLWKLMRAKALYIAAGAAAVVLSVAPLTSASVFVSGDAGNLWIVNAQTDGSFVLLHRAADDPSDVIYRALNGKGHPVAIAADHNLLYCVYSDMSVQSLTFGSRDSGYLPALQTQQLAPLPRDGQLMGLIAGADGPVALLKFQPQARGAETTTNATHEPDGDAEHDSAEPAPFQPLRLLRLHRDTWTPIDLPADLNANELQQVVMADPKYGRIALLCDTRPPRGLTVHMLTGITWAKHQYPLKFSPLSQAVGVHGDLAMIVPLAGVKSPQLNVFYLRLGSATPLGTLGPIQTFNPWWTAYYDNQAAVVTTDADNHWIWANKGLETGSAHNAVFTPLGEATPTFKVNPTTTIFLVAIIVGMLFLFGTARRVPGSNAPRLPASLVPAGFSRVMAAVLDFAPPIAAAMIYFGIRNPADLITPWFSANDWRTVIPAAAAVGLFIAHTTLTELVLASTLGKALMGIRVSNLYGGYPHLWQVLARNLFKAIELAAPLLLVLPLMSGHHQRLGDMVARTLVVADAPPRRLEKEPLDDDLFGPDL
ncbi:MAG: hypothetical protein GC162_02240 [Planctomycetes bacterium]|nr:hypothetical protein [Planctomycetota bacterium]